MALLILALMANTSNTGLRGQKHRTDGPAVELPNGDYEFWLNGKHHNLNGPAACYSDLVEYWIDGKQYTNKGEYLMKLFEMGYVKGKKFI